MSITVNNSINVECKLPKGTATSYNTNTISLFVEIGKEQKRFNPTSLTNATTSTDGVIKFNNVNLWKQGVYKLQVTSETSADLDTDKVGLNIIGVSVIGKFDNTTTLKM